MTKANSITIGIDATNLRAGGGITHLVELLRVAKPKNQGIDRIVVWGGTHILDLIEDHPWITKHDPSALNKGLLQRILWQRFQLSRSAYNENCDLLFVPGGSYAGHFRPIVTMSQNLLPFEMRELKRYGWSLVTIKLLLLRLTQSRSFTKSDGVIFLTEYARSVVLRVTGDLHGQSCIVPHGLSGRFTMPPKSQHNIADYDDDHPYRVLYVSTIEQYKHQWHVVEAVASMRKKGLPIELNLVGPAYPPALRRLNKIIHRVDAEGNWVHHHGAIPFNEVHHHYALADLGLFASSCENMPNILLETMASGLPIACSNMGPMPEVLREGGVYFDPEQPSDIAHALSVLIESAMLRTEVAHVSYENAKLYSWHRCANETLEFLHKVAQKHSVNHK